MRGSYALHEHAVIRRERAWIRIMTENVSQFDSLIVKVLISHNLVRV